jgi:hypothetical protein
MCVCAHRQPITRANLYTPIDTHMYTPMDTHIHKHTTQGDASTVSGARQEIDVEGMSRDVSAVAAHLQVCMRVCETERDKERQRDGCVFAHDAGGVCLRRERGGGRYANTRCECECTRDRETQREMSQKRERERKVR